MGTVLRRERLALGALEPGDALVEPLLGSWEANIDHAISRSPIDVCSTRGDDVVLLGNLGIVRVLDVRAGGGPQPVRAGDVCMVMPFGKVDRHGYAELVHAYDCPGTLGLLARRSRMPARLLLPVPEGTTSSLEQWATYGRYFTAWDNWNAARRCWRAQVPDADPADHLVFAWGGGVSLALVTLARREGFRVAMAASSDARLELLRTLGIVPVDRRRFPALAVPPRAGGVDPDYAERHEASMAAFLEIVGELSDGHGVAVLADNIGAPLYKATLAALAREGVVTTCGWKAGMRVAHLRGAECISRHTHVHTHCWRQQESQAIRDVQESEGWIAPAGSTRTWDFVDVPVLAREYAAGRVESYFPLYAVNPA